MTRSFQRYVKLDSGWLDSELTNLGGALNLGGGTSSQPTNPAPAPSAGSSGSGSSFNQTFSTITTGLSSVLGAFGSFWGSVTGGNKTTASGMPVPPTSGSGGTPAAGMSTTMKILIGSVATMAAIVVGILLFKKYK